MVGRLVALALGGALVLAPGFAWAQAACTQLTVTGHPEYPPVGYRDGEAIAGAGAMLVKEIADKLGIPVVLRYTGSWDDAQAATRTGAADIIFGIYYNDQRATYLDYVQAPFMIDPAVIMVRRGSGFAFAGQNDLIGRRGVTNLGESYGVAFDAFMAQSLMVARAQGVDAVFAELLEGRADYMIMGLYPGLAKAQELGIADRIEVLAPTVVDADMFVAFSKLSPCLALMTTFATEIAAMRASGRIDALIVEATAIWNASIQPAPAPR